MQKEDCRNGVQGPIRSPSGSLSCIDILVGSIGVMRFDSNNPGWEDRDRFTMGHASPAVYSILREIGYWKTRIWMVSDHLDQYVGTRRQ